ncbi:SAM pointed domain-containing Ets transcription factor-like [Osmerus mordax]|uniref:SAM pointed domain-containing Ets transcription factor-like n=1 Tax=Osmerus mordax TaxID=8014 RepID=UPI00350F9D87
MGSPDSDRVGSTTQIPFYSSTPHTAMLRALEDEEEDVKPPRGLPGAPERSLHGVYWDVLLNDDSSWRLKATTPCSLPACRAPEQRPVVNSQAQAIGSSAGLEGQLEERSLEQVQTMVVGEVMKDIETACKLLNITPEPMEWSSGHVQKWLLWTEHLYRLPQVGRQYQELSGRDLCSMTEEDFRQRSLQCGDMLYAHLDIWRSAACMKERFSTGNDRINGADEQCPEADSCCSSQPIHLWQFLRELLLKPHNYGHSIRWLNKEKGIFKIEDSAHVARLWGIRKNRPAMNYDKLSRSIRQYYKKGIIRKPDVSQRLVYQFVKPV